MSDNKDNMPDSASEESMTAESTVKEPVESKPVEKEQRQAPVATDAEAAKEAVTANSVNQGEQRIRLEKDTLPPEQTAALVNETENENQKSQETCDKPIPASAWASVFNGLAKGGPIALLVVLCLMVWPDFWQPGKVVFCPGEYDTISAFFHSISKNSWLMPTAFDSSGAQIPQWPLFFWLLGLLALIPSLVESGYLLHLAAFINAALAVIAIGWLSHAARFGYKAAFAAGAILLCTPLYGAMAHVVGPYLLASSLALLSLVFFCYGWRAKRAYFSLPCAFIFSGLAGLCAGPLFLIFPLLASLIFLIWQGRLGRAQSLDAMFGFILLLAVVGTWLGTIMLGNSESNYLRDVFAQSWQFNWPLNQRWWLPLALACGATMPWLLMILGVSWIHVIGSSPKTLAASRKDNGSALVWISLVFAGCMSLFATAPPYVAITTLSLLTILLGKAFTNLSPAGNRFFFLLASLFLIIIGIIMLGGSFNFSQELLIKHLPAQISDKIMPVLPKLSNLPIIGGIIILGGLLAIFFVVRNRATGGLIYALLFMLCLTQAIQFLLKPDLVAALNTKLVSLETLESRYNGIASKTPPAVEKIEPAPGQTQQLPPAQPAEQQQVQVESRPDIAEPAAPESPKPDVPGNVIPENSQEPVTANVETAPVMEKPVENTATQTPETASEPNIVPDVNKAIEEGQNKADTQSQGNPQGVN